MKQSMSKQSLGDRMKEYEYAYNIRLPRRLPVIMRLDGRAFHTLTRKAEKPFDPVFIDIMNVAAVKVCEEIQGAQIAYIQSDEISILIHNYKTLESDAWFDNKIQKMVSIGASVASSVFSILANDHTYPFEELNLVQFDARVFVLPEQEVCNYFIWRQQDWERNSIQMLAQSLYSHKELHQKNQKDMQEMCFKKGKNWNDLPTNLKRGRCIYKVLAYHRLRDASEQIHKIWSIDNDIPIFTQDRHFIDKFLKVDEQ